MIPLRCQAGVKPGAAGKPETTGLTKL